jgi:hypothetical protein
MAEQTIICPNCGKRIPVTKALTAQIEAGLRRAYENDAKKQQQKLKDDYAYKLSLEITRVEKEAQKKASEAAEAELIKLQQQLANAQKRENVLQADFDKRLVKERLRIETEAKSKAQKDISQQLKSLRGELQEKTKQISEFDKLKQELQKQQGQLKAKEEALDIEVSRRVDKMMRKAEQDITNKVEAEHHIHELELEKKLSDAKRQAIDLKRKLEQSSQKEQGEVVEIELENALKKAFPNDIVEPVPNGRSGGDVLHKVYSADGAYCGTIIWELKNTRSWSKMWLSKLRADQRREKAELAVLVSAALPKDFHFFGQIDGVWIAELPLSICLATALRINLIQVSLLRISSKGKQEKMEMLYAYLSSSEFRHRVEAIVEAFSSMRDDLARERLMMEKQWAKREKQIELVIENVSGMYGDMQGMAGHSLPQIKRLELPIQSSH